MVAGVLVRFLHNSLHIYHQVGITTVLLLALR